MNPHLFPTFQRSGKRLCHEIVRDQRIANSNDQSSVAVVTTCPIERLEIRRFHCTTTTKKTPITLTQKRRTTIMRA